MHIKHTGYANFAVKNYDQNNNNLDLLVNTIGNYEGNVPANFLDDEVTTRLEIVADGSWEVSINPLDSARIFAVPTQITGVSDDVVVLSGNPDLLKAQSGPAMSNFAIWAFGGDGRDLVINEIAPYTGTVLLPNGTFILVIVAEGNWSLEVTGR